MPKVLIYGTIVVIFLAMVPPAVIAWARAVNSSQPRIHLIQDMDNQPKFRAQHANALFADGRAMRPPITGTVARGGLNEDDHYYRGISNGQWAATFPPQVAVTMDLLQRGRERFNIYCQPCHGLAGYGDGMVNRRAMLLMNLGVNGTTWVQPKSVHEQQIREQPVGQYFNTITNGVRNMPAYGPQIPVADRWAIVAYVRALQRSQNARPDDAPPGQRVQLQSVTAQMRNDRP
ncbi:MAG: cytochrome c [Planctomycetota bacterium]|nr:cytochrome c [Planctomycetota bacterium]MCZ6493530.1 cytochrome c [Planctomycetota bacterium]MCZ6543066.1 cytochrome c [Planctomycetota bacterium]MCZ6612606.1 cytochrome c [Planctomycetota bacterium]MCZ6735199.1 cytochrome c [Planctomycetota bacterium]